MAFPWDWKVLRLAQMVGNPVQKRLQMLWGQLPAVPDVCNASITCGDDGYCCTATATKPNTLARVSVSVTPGAVEVPLNQKQQLE